MICARGYRYITYIYTLMYVYIYIRTHVYTYICTYTYTYVYIYILFTYTHSYTERARDTHTHTPTHRCMPLLKSATLTQQKIQTLELSGVVRAWKDAIGYKVPCAVLRASQGVYISTKGKQGHLRPGFLRHFERWLQFQTRAFEFFRRFVDRTKTSWINLRGAYGLGVWDCMTLNPSIVTIIIIIIIIMIIMVIILILIIIIKPCTFPPRQCSIFQV